MNSIARIVASCVVLTGCSSTPNLNTTKPPVDNLPPQLRIAFAPQCPSKAEATKEGLLGSLAIGIATSVGQKIAGGSIDALSKYLTSDKAYTLEDSARMSGFAKWTQEGKVQLNDKESCMIVVIGREFSTQLLEDISDTLEDVAQPFDDYNKEAVYSATGLVGTPLLYLEARLSANGSDKVPRTHFAFIPVQWYYPDFVGDGGWRFKDRRDVMLKVEIIKPGTNVLLGGLEIKQGDVLPGAIKNESIVNDNQPWNPLPDDLDDAAPGTKFDSEQVIYPVNVSALFVETAKPKTIVKYIGEAVSEQREKIVAGVGDEIKESLDQSTRLANRSTALGAATEKYNDYLEAYDEAFNAVDKYQKSTGAAKLKSQNEARLAKKKLAISRAIAKAAFKDAGVGSFEELPILAEIE